MIRSGDEPGLSENYQDLLTGLEPELSGSRYKAYQSLPINKLVAKMSDDQACRFACDCVERAMQGTAYVHYSDGQWLISYTRAYLNGRLNEKEYLDKTHILYEKFRTESLISDHIAEQHPRFSSE